MQQEIHLEISCHLGGSATLAFGRLLKTRTWYVLLFAFSLSLQGNGVFVQIVPLMFPLET